MRKRYYVEMCNNGNTLESGKRITWACMDRVTGHCITDRDTRAQARKDVAELNAEGSKP